MPALDWLLDPADPGVRYLALRDILRLPDSNPDLLRARQEAHSHGPIATVLQAMQSEGYWCKPGAGYNPKYRSTVWALILLSQLGASIAMDERIGRGCTYLLDHALTTHGQFSVNGTPSGTIDCLQGNLCAALVMLGCRDPRLSLAYEWMASTVSGEGIAPASESKAPRRYYAYKCGPGFACGVNGRLPCAWGAVKVMLAFNKLPTGERTPLIDQAIRQGIDFLLGIDPATAAYPTRADIPPNRSWWKFGFPVFYVTDLLQLVEVLVGMGAGDDPRLENALERIRQKQDAQGRWQMEYDTSGKTWVVFGTRNEANKWVTLRALTLLSLIAQGK